jgi:hypothetical protein
MLLFNVFVINLTYLLDGDASQMPYIPNGTKIFIATSTANLRAVRYFSSIGKVNTVLKFFLINNHAYQLPKCILL